MRAVLDYVARTSYVGGSAQQPAKIPRGSRAAIFAAVYSIWCDRVGEPVGPFAQRVAWGRSAAAERISRWLRRAPLEEFSWFESGLIAIEGWEAADLESSYDPHLVLEGWLRQQAASTPTAAWLWLLGVGGEVEDIADRWGEYPEDVLEACQDYLDNLRGRIGWQVWYYNVDVDIIFGGTTGSLLERAAKAHRAKESPMLTGNGRWREILKALFAKDPDMLEFSANTGEHRLLEPAWVAPPLVG